MGEVRCDKLRERDAQSVLSGFLAITDRQQTDNSTACSWRLQAVLLMIGCLMTARRPVVLTK